MKKLLVLLVLSFGLFMLSCCQVKHSLSSRTSNETIVDTIGIGSDRDPDVYVYKCVDTLTNEIIYVDLLELGYVGFFSNKTFVKYKVDMYALTAKDSSWEYEFVSIRFQSNMPINVMVFDPDETQITMYLNTDDSTSISVLSIEKKIVGFEEFLYVKNKNKYATFIYGDDKIPVYIQYNTK